MINDYVRLKKIAKEAGEQFGQDSVMVVSDHINDASFIPGTWKKRIERRYLGKKRELFN